MAAILGDPDRLVTFSGCTAHRATVWLATGPGAWEWAARHPRHLAVVLPTDSDPAAYSWKFLAGHEPTIIIGPAVVDPEQRDQIARALLRDGVGRVLAGRTLLCRPTRAAA